MTPELEELLASLPPVQRDQLERTLPDLVMRLGGPADQPLAAAIERCDMLAELTLSALKMMRDRSDELANRVFMTTTITSAETVEAAVASLKAAGVPEELLRAFTG